MSGLVTLKEYSEKQGIKKPTVNARLKGLEKKNKDKTLTVKKNNVIYLTEVGIDLLDQSFKDNPVKATYSKQGEKVFKDPGITGNSNSELTDSYKQQIKSLEKQLDASRKEKEYLLKVISQLTDTNAKLSDSVSNGLSNSQKLQDHEQQLRLIDKTGGNDKPIEEKKKKKSLLARLAVATRVITGGY